MYTIPSINAGHAIDGCGSSYLQADQQTELSNFSQGTAVSSTNKTNRHDITTILLKVELNTITLTFSKYNTKHSYVTHSASSSRISPISRI
jgi:hypothetical protein